MIVKHSILIAIVSVLTISITSCKKFSDPGVIWEDYKPDSVSPKTENNRHLLFISIDGLSSSSLLSIAPPEINSLLSNAKYSWNLKPAMATNASSWASMMTGNDNTIHGIWDSSFYAKPPDTTNAVPVAPNLTVLRMVYNFNPLLNKSTVISSWNNLVHVLMKDGDKKMVTSDDLATKAATIEEIKTGQSKIIITQFGDVFNAGKNDQFSSNAPSYKAAVLKTSTYIQEMVKEIKNRSSYNQENWLVIITTTQGGQGIRTDKNVLPGFLIAYNPGFKTQDLTKMNPAINVLKEDVARMILYWTQTPPVPNAILTGQLWLDRFGVEFIK